MRFTLAMTCLFLLASCGGADQLPALDLNEGDTVTLTAADGSTPAILKIGQQPTSQQGTSQGQTINVDFDGTIDYRIGVAFNSIQATISAGRPITSRLIFVDTERNETEFIIADIPFDQASNSYVLTQPILRARIPVPLENIAKIVLEVENKEVAAVPKL